MSTGISTAGIFENNNCFLIAKRAPDEKSGGRWEFPGGKAEINEAPEEALKREYKEEFDVDIKVNELIFSGEFYNKHKKYLILAYKIDFDTSKIKLTEHSEVCWVKKEDLKKYNFFYSDMLIVNFLQRKQETH